MQADRDIPVPLRFASAHEAWCKARRGKKPSANQLAFESRWLDRLLQLHADLRAGAWRPRRTVSFVVRHPKTREIHAPDFADRVVHHVLVPRLEALYEPVFIHDSYANRQGKGSHAAVDRLQIFMRQRNGRGWFLQLDVHNFFNNIHRPGLYALLKDRLAKAERSGKLPPRHALALQSLCHKLLAHPVREVCRDPLTAAAVPPHKRLRNARPGCGLPIGNLSSQFFANVVLNELDQFVKHQLKVRHYVRYVDDFVLLADDAATLRDWHEQVSRFLRERLRLRLKDEHRLASLSQGIDFLGYVVWATHRRVRPRVVAHCREKLQLWGQRHVRILGGEADRWLEVRAEPAALDRLRALLASYWGHFSHARSVRLRQALFGRFEWLRALFHLTQAGALVPRWVLQGETLAHQVDWLRAQWPGAVCEVQKGCEVLRFAPLGSPDGSRVRAEQTGWLRHGTRRREIALWRVPLSHLSHLSIEPGVSS